MGEALKLEGPQLQLLLLLQLEFKPSDSPPAPRIHYPLIRQTLPPNSSLAGHSSAGFRFLIATASEAASVLAAGRLARCWLLSRPLLDGAILLLQSLWLLLLPLLI